MMIIAAGTAMANPEDGVVAAGAANITSSGSTTNINQSTQNAVIDWRSFNIGASETTKFVQPSSSSTTLNRVNSGGASIIDGNLIANGNIFIVNQNGVLFGQNSRVDVNGLVASTADIDNANFMNGNFRFDQAGRPDATIENRGMITAGDAGLIGLVAPNVVNSGVIQARLGRVQLASGDKATVDLYGDGLMEITADDYTSQRLVENAGTIKAAGGKIALTAEAGATMVNNLVRVSGELSAPAVGVKNGTIIIGAEGSNAVAGNVAANKGIKSGSSKVVVADALLDVSGKNSGEKGGHVAITGDDISVSGTTKIDATGYARGGSILIGGNNPSSMPTAQATDNYDINSPLAVARETSIAAPVVMDASATGAGDGGHVVIFSDERTEVAATIKANGAGDNGNGGFAETSSKDLLLAYGLVNLIAGQYGSAGTWLLDPADITIAGTDANTTGNPNYTPTGSGSQVSVSSILTNLNAGTNVTITTANNGYSGNGDIFVNSAITATGGGSLTLSAYRDVNVAAGVTLNGGSLNLQANNASTGAGTVFVNANTNLASTGGAITINKLASNSSNIGTIGINSGGGSININNIVAGSATSGRYQLTAGAGAITFGAVNTAANVTASATSMTLNSAWGTTTPQGNVTLTSVNSLTLPAITTAAGRTVRATVSGAANSITTTGAIATGTGGNITLTADDLVLGGNLSGTGTVTLRPNAVSRVTRINYGAGDFNLSAAEIAYLVDNWSNIVVGRDVGNTDGAMYIGTSHWLDPVLFTNGSGQTVYGDVTSTSNILFEQGWGNATTWMDGGASISATGNITFSRSAAGNVDVESTNGNISFNDNLVDAHLDARANNGTIYIYGYRNGEGAARASTITLNPTGDFINNANNGIDYLSLIAVNSITLPSIKTYSSLFVQTTGANADLILGSGATLRANATGAPVTLVAGRNFINNSGSAAPIVLAAGGRSMIYSTTPTDDTLGGMASAFVRYGCSYGGSCPTGVTVPSTGNGWLYSYQPTLTITPTALAALTYGDAAPNLSGYAYDITGYLTSAAGNDDVDDTLTGTLNGSTTYSATSNAGNHEIDYASGTLSSALGYQFAYDDNSAGIVVGKKTLTATAANQTIYEDVSVPGTTVSYSGFVNGDTDAVINTRATAASANSGTLTAGSYLGNYTPSGALDNNYDFTYVAGNLTVLAGNSPLPPPSGGGGNNPPVTVSNIPNTYLYTAQQPPLISIVSKSYVDEYNVSDENADLPAFIYGAKLQGSTGPALISISPELQTLLDM